MEDTGPKNEIIIYEGLSGQPRIEVRVENETVWLTQDRIAELFGVKRPAITKHLKNIFETRHPRPATSPAPQRTRRQKMRIHLHHHHHSYHLLLKIIGINVK